MPQFYTANESLEAGNEKETVEEEVLVPEGAIWDLSSRWNQKHLLSKDFHVVHFLAGQTRTAQSRR